MEDLEYLESVSLKKIYNPNSLIITIKKGMWMMTLTNFLKERGYFLREEIICVDISCQGNNKLYTFETVNSKQGVWVVLDTKNSCGVGGSILY